MRKAIRTVTAKVGQQRAMAKRTLSLFSAFCALAHDRPLYLTIAGSGTLLPIMGTAAPLVFALSLHPTAFDGGLTQAQGPASCWSDSEEMPGRHPYHRLCHRHNGQPGHAHRIAGPVQPRARSWSGHLLDRDGLPHHVAPSYAPLLMT